MVVAGMAAGFAGLFGTPWAAIVFSLEKRWAGFVSRVCCPVSRGLAEL